MRELPSRLRGPRAGLLIASTAALAALDALAITPGWPYAVVFGVPVLAGAALLVRDRRRRTLLAVAALVLSSCGTLVLAVTDYHYLGTWGVTETAVLLVLLVSSWRRAAGRVERAVAGAAAVAVVVQPLRGNLLDAPIYVALLTAAAAAAAAGGVALRSADAQQRIAVAAVRRAEREEVARELHDVVAHHVTGMVVAAQAARAVLITGSGQVPRAVADALASIDATGSEALASMRRMVGILRTDPDSAANRQPTPQIAHLGDLVDRFRAAGAADRVDLDVDDDGAPLPAEVQAGVYRVVQESLTNAARHARGAAFVRVVVARTDAGVRVQVLDTGGRSGAPATAAGGGFGVLGMAERVTALGGELVAGPHGDGWLVEATVPLDGPARGSVTTDPSERTT